MASKLCCGGAPGKGTFANRQQISTLDGSQFWPLEKSGSNCVHKLYFVQVIPTFICPFGVVLLH